MIIYRVKRHNHHQRIGLVDDFPAPKRYVPEFLFKGSRFKEGWLFQRDVDNFYLKSIENIVIQ